MSKEQLEQVMALTTTLSSKEKRTLRKSLGTKKEKSPTPGERQRKYKEFLRTGRAGHLVHEGKSG